MEEKTVHKLGLAETFYEIERLKNRKEHLIKIYCGKYSLTASQIKEVMVSGGGGFNDAMLKKILKYDDILVSISEIETAIASWSEYLTKEIGIRLREGDDTPVIVYLKDFVDLENNKQRTFEEVASIVHMGVRTVKRKYYDYKNSL